MYKRRDGRRDIVATSVVVVVVVGAPLALLTLR